MSTDPNDDYNTADKARDYSNVDKALPNVSDFSLYM